MILMTLQKRMMMILIQMPRYCTGSNISFKESHADTVTLKMPRKGLAKALTPAAGRMQMSTNKSFAYAAVIIKASDGKMSDFAISRATFFSV